MNKKVIIVSLVFIFLAIVFFGALGMKIPSKTQKVKLSSPASQKDQTPSSQSSNISSEKENLSKVDLGNQETDQDFVQDESEPWENSQDLKQTSSSPKKKEAVSDKSKISVKNHLVSWGYQKTSGRLIDTIIIHSSYNAVGSDSHDLDDIIEKEYKPAGVSPHYIISREGQTYRLVEDQNIAYHAGVSKVPDGRENVNTFSIGIEIVETKSESPNKAQYASLGKLLDYLKAKYKIKYILGHSDIAPGRKDDPWNFDWGKINK